MSGTAPFFDANFQEKLEELIRWRRDVRRFRTAPIDEEVLDELLDLAQFAPSVGNSQPWRFMRVESPEKRRAIRDNFKQCNEEALNALNGERAQLYAKLKLEGLNQAPAQFAIFCDRGVTQGHGLGVRTIPEALDYSVSGMIACLWLAARAKGLGLGWVSILDPQRLCVDLNAPGHYKFIAYLCLGWPEEEHEDPELARLGWQERGLLGRNVPRV